MEQEMKNLASNRDSRPRKKQGWLASHCCCGKKEWIDTMKNTRMVYFNDADANAANPHTFLSNYIKTHKYTFLGFLPKNLFEQFQKAANFYFLIQAIIVCIPGISTIEPFTSIMPLAFVLSVTAIKEAYEDYKRYKEDLLTNMQVVQKLVDGKEVNVRWQDIQVGDILKLKDGAEIPVDMVLISSSDPNGIASMMTANLDGETNLKSRQALRQTLEYNSPETLQSLEGAVICGPPDARLDFFEGVWQANGKEFALNQEQLLLRGARMMDTTYAYGIAVYTGYRTKLFLNSNNPRFKRSNVEWTMNRQMFAIFFLQFVVCLVSAVWSAVWRWNSAHDHWYLYIDSESAGEVLWIGFRNFLAFYILYSVMVPVSLYVSIELVKVAQSILIFSDIQMYDPRTDTCAAARTSNLNEELGQIKYVFSDKTGTLTQNKMSLHDLSIDGQKYTIEAFSEIKSEDDFEEFAPSFPRQSTVTEKMMNAHDNFFNAKLARGLMEQRGQSEKSQKIQDVMKCLSLCHTVNPVYNGDMLDYRGVSIDEVALVLAANQCGFVFKNRDREQVIIDTPFAKNQEYTVLNSLEFTSERKRMTVVLRTPEGGIKVYSKGADSVMFSLLKETTQNHDLLPVTQEHLEEFSIKGLRTLVLCGKDMDEAEYNEWAAKYEEASKAMGNRREKMEAVAEEIERDLDLIGVTSIEDALQEEVVETLQSLRRAGIKVWMLTGDKQGTAVNIGKSAGLVDQNLQVHYLNGLTLEDVNLELKEECATLDQIAGEHKSATDIVVVADEPSNDEPATGNQELSPIAKAADSEVDQKPPERLISGSIYVDPNDEAPLNKFNVALVVDGPTLTLCMHPDNQQLFFDAINHSRTHVVICSRMAPKQKASIVDLIKTKLGAITLAIGDGANDVSMIQSAHVGVGIRGKEGLQAFNNSDYGISQFKFLKRLLFVHGRLSFKRNSKLILYCFYKSAVITTTQWWFSFFSEFSAQEIYVGILLNTFNLFWSSLPILMLAFFERDLEPAELMAIPELYKPGIFSSGFNIRVFWGWMFNGFIHGSAAFFFPWFVLRDLGYWAQSIGAYTTLVFVANFKIASMCTTWVSWVHVWTWASIIVYLLTAYAMTAFPTGPFPYLYNTTYQVLTTPSFWLMIVMVCWLTMLFKYVDAFLRRAVRKPTLKLVVQERRLLKQKDKPISREDLGL